MTESSDFEQRAGVGEQLAGAITAMTAAVKQIEADQETAGGES